MEAKGLADWHLGINKVGFQLEFGIQVIYESQVAVRG